MNDKLNSNQQRWLAIGLLIAVIFLLMTAIAWPLWAKQQEINATIDDLVFRIQRYKKIVASRDQIFDQVEQTRHQIEEQGYLSDQDSEAVASAEMQQFIKNTISTAGGNLTSTQVLPRKEEGNLIRFGVRIRLSGTIEMLRNVLYEIETSKPLLVVEQIDITPVRGRRNPRTRQFEASDQLNINLTVVSFMRKIS